MFPPPQDYGMRLTPDSLSHVKKPSICGLHKYNMYLYIFQICPFFFYCHMEGYDGSCPNQLRSPQLQHISLNLSDYIEICPPLIIFFTLIFIYSCHEIC